MARGSAKLSFPDPQWRPDGASATSSATTPGRGPSPSMIQCWSPILVLPCSPLEPPLAPQELLCFSRVSLPGQLAARPGFIGSPCLAEGLPDLAELWSGPRAFALALAG